MANLIFIFLLTVDVDRYDFVVYHLAILVGIWLKISYIVMV